MLNPDTPQEFNFSDAPGGDQTLDDIFNIGDTTSTTTQTQQEPTPDTFLQTATGTVYKTADEAVKGIEHKDALISQLRQQLAEQTGRDPIKNPVVQDDPARISYLDDPKKYFEDIKNAKTEQEVLQVQSRFMDEKMAPYASLIASVAKSRAVEEASHEIPEFTKFLGSDDYKSTLDSYPLLKRSIEISEANPAASGDLGQLYRMAYNASAGRNVSKIVRTAGVQTPVAETRPTVSSTSQVAPGTVRVAPLNLNTSEGRKAIQAEQIARGVEDLRF